MDASWFSWRIAPAHLPDGIWSLAWNDHRNLPHAFSWCVGWPVNISMVLLSWWMWTAFGSAGRLSLNGLFSFATNRHHRSPGCAWQCWSRTYHWASLSWSFSWISYGSSCVWTWSPSSCTSSWWCAACNPSECSRSMWTSSSRTACRSFWSAWWSTVALLGSRRSRVEFQFVDFQMVLTLYSDDSPFFRAAQRWRLSFLGTSNISWVYSYSQYEALHHVTWHSGWRHVVQPGRGRKLESAISGCWLVYCGLCACGPPLRDVERSPFENCVSSLWEAHAQQCADWTESLFRRWGHATGMEHPAPPFDPDDASIWRTQLQFKFCMKAPSSQQIIFHQRRFGAPSVKPTTLRLLGLLPAPMPFMPKKSLVCRN